MIKPIDIGMRTRHHNFLTRLTRNLYKVAMGDSNQKTRVTRAALPPAQFELAFLSIRINSYKANTALPTLQP